LISLAVLLSLAYFTFGYDGSVGGGILAMPSFIKQYGSKGKDGTYSLSATDISVMTAVPTSGAVIGSVIAAYAGDRIGRKRTLYIGCLFSIVGASIQTASYNVATMTVGRLFANVAIFIFIVMSATFQAEIAPSSIRGAIVGMSIVLIDAAAVVTSGINWATYANPTSLAYRLPLGLQILWPIVIGAGLLFVHESPTYFLIKGQDEKAEDSLRRVRQGYTDDQINAEFDALKWQAALRKEENDLPWNELFKGTTLRRTLVSMSIGNFQQPSGIAFATNYATIFLTQIGGSVNPFLLVLGLNILALGGAITGLFLVDLIGRRTLALTTFLIIFIIDVVVGSLGFVDATKNPAVSKTIAAFCLMFAFFFAAGFGPLTYIVSSEVPTARLRNKTSAFTFLVLALFSLVVVYVLPYIANANAGNLGAKTYIIFAGWMLMCTVITYFCLPETKGRSPAELDEMFAAKVPARKFRGMMSITMKNLNRLLIIWLCRLYLQRCRGKFPPPDGKAGP
ncbi:general substrate transporter, partial [Halenospora varia]